jgi:hypothetical protein
MEARQPSCEYLFRYVARGVSLVVELFVLPSLYIRFGKSKKALWNSRLATAKAGAADQARLRQEWLPPLREIGPSCDR